MPAPHQPGPEFKKGTTSVESISAEAACALNYYFYFFYSYYYYYRRTGEEDRGGPRIVLSAKLVLAFLILAGGAPN